MSRAYAALFGATVLLGLALVLFGRLAPRRPPSAAPPVAAARVDTLAIEVGAKGIQPAASAVPKDSRVVLLATNRRGAPITLSLAGYENEVPPEPIAAGMTRAVTFVASLPGDDFAWLVDGQPVGRLRVTGSHLVEGHR